MNERISVLGPLIVLRRHCGVYLFCARSEIMSWKRPEIKTDTRQLQLTLWCSFKHFCFVKITELLDIIHRRNLIREHDVAETGTAPAIVRILPLEVATSSVD